MEPETYINKNIEEQIYEVLADEIKNEIDKEIMSSMQQQVLLHNGWICVTVKSWNEITDKWCEKSLTDAYKCYGHYWYFKSQKDANIFALAWMS